MELSDKDYVQRSRDGSPEDFRWLVERYQKPLCSFLARRMSNSSEVEEAAQESFVRAFRALPKLRQPESFYSWLLGIAARVLKEQFRSQARRERDRAVAATLLAEQSAPEPDYPLEEALAALPETYRQVILLRYYEGRSCQEIATRLAMPLGSVTKTLSRAYAQLRLELQEHERLESTVKPIESHELR